MNHINIGDLVILRDEPRNDVYAELPQLKGSILKVIEIKNNILSLQIPNISHYIVTAHTSKVILAYCD